MDRQSMLQSVPFFAGLSPEELARVAGSAEELRFLRGDFIFRQDEQADHLFVVREGHVKVTQLTPHGDQILLRFMTSGEMFGGIAVVEDTVFPASAEAADDCTVLAWRGATVRHLMSEMPAIAIGVVQHLSKFVQDLQLRLQELATERVEQRVARALVRLASQVGQRTEDGILINVALSRQDLAEMTGTTLFSVSRILSGWEKRSLIDTGRERVVIRKPHALVTIAEDLPVHKG